MFFAIAMLAIARIEEDNRWLYLVGLGFALAFLSKSWHAGPILVVLGSYLILSGQWSKLHLREVLLFAFCSGFPVLFWAVLRFGRDGFTFFDLMIRTDLLKRTSQPLEGHVGNFWYYFEVLKGNYLYWAIFLALALLLQRFFKPEGMPPKAGLAIILWIVVPFLLFSVARTKLAWYILPIYPALAIWMGCTFSRMIRGNARHLAFQSLLFLGILGCLAKNEGSILIRIRQVPPAGHQLALQQIASMPQYRGAKIFTMCGTYGGAGHWDQAHLLCAELYGDLKAKNGGLGTFLQDKNSLLLVPKSEMTDALRQAMVWENAMSCLVRTPKK
ncbi:MAG TPA: hypothetical protein DD435_12445 [Cyanobacteria bacterium UBA8530]|nr:hypothetical protein [Cyanobacteria bacterium UBA8530]